jgi:hypothetical protein
MKIHKLNEDFEDYEFENLFRMLFDIEYGTNKNSIEFLKSLNLTNEQYERLADIILEYGSNQYRDGVSDGQSDY